ncbi:glycosyltransferase family A protein [Aeromonas enteropelogenes]|uniref:glycosyltransferase family A protein n=1 Tax=Aeromonas enteropelogenes TaxID=29489 RepID=UPI003B9F2D06
MKSSDSILYTIFTPTFNRAHTLERCYYSIIHQNEDSLEWIVIDDGSTDNTEDIIANLISIDKIKIRYIYQMNAGKQAAWNKAAEEADGKFFICLDSDDELVPNALKRLFPYLKKVETLKEIIGIRAVAIKDTTLSADSSFSANSDRIASWFDEFSSRQLGERIDVLKTNEIKKYPYPVIYGVKYIPEVWFYVITAHNGFSFLYINEHIRIFHDAHRHLRLSKSKLSQHFRGHLISRGVMLRYIPPAAFMKNPISFFKTLVRFIQCSILNWFKK